VANDDPETGYQIRLNGHNEVLGGTGATALWAGFIALINQGVGKNVGFVNPLLYKTLGPAGVLRPVAPEKGGVAAPGWHLGTGWGSPDGRKLIAAIRAALGR
jgi:kumamolisin